MEKERSESKRTERVQTNKQRRSEGRKMVTERLNKHRLTTKDKQKQQFLVDVFS